MWQLLLKLCKNSNKNWFYWMFFLMLGRPTDGAVTPFISLMWQNFWNFPITAESEQCHTTWREHVIHISVCDWELQSERKIKSCVFWVLFSATEQPYQFKKEWLFPQLYVYIQKKDIWRTVAGASVFTAYKYSYLSKYL